MTYTSRVGNIIGVGVSFWVVSFAAFAGRIWVRLIKKRAGLWWDDWLIIVSMLLITGKTLTTTIQIAWGVGYHIEDLPPMENRIEHLLKLWYVDQIQYVLCVGTVKLSILFFYLRISNSLRVPVFLTVAFVACVTISTTLVVLFQCTPVSFMWDKKNRSGKCVDMTKFWTAGAALNIVSDCIIYVMPMRTLWHVQLPIRERIGIVAVFAAGAMVVVIGIVRLHSLTIISQSEDITWVNSPSMLWSTAELELGVVCACLPALKQLFGRAFGFTKNVSCSDDDGYGAYTGDTAGTDGSKPCKRVSRSVYPLSVTDTVLVQMSGYEPNTGVNTTVDARVFERDSSKEVLFENGSADGKILKTTDVTVTSRTP